MSVTKLTTLGEITTNFLLNDVTVYIMNTSATGSYVSTDWAVLGYTSAEKKINPVNELYTREDKIPRIPTYQKTIKKGLEVKCELSNQNASIEALLKQGTTISLGATGTKISYGTDEGTKEYRAVRFAATLDNGTKWTLTIPKCSITQDGEKTVGGEKETVTPLLFAAMYNPSANATGNLYYEEYLASGVSATATVPRGYN